MQKNVLMISAQYFPSNSSGVHRAVGNAKYLPSFGWNPTVICKYFTAKNSPVTFDPYLAEVADTCHVIRVNAIGGRVVDRLGRMFWNTFGGGLHDYRSPYIFFRKMKKVADDFVRSQEVTVIWSTSNPGMDHGIAAYLAKKYSIPWVADFRDLPDQSRNSKQSRVVVKQEMKICAGASAIVSTTEELSEKLKMRHDTPVYTILNGFDPEEYQIDKHALVSNDKFTINHFGWLYEYRNPQPLFEAIDRLTEQGRVDLNDISVNFFGANADMVQRFASPYRCADQIHAGVRLNYGQMIATQLQSQVLLLVAPPQQGGAIPAKLYSYLASQRPILNVPGDKLGTDRIIIETKAGVSLSEPGKIADWLERAYNDWKKTGNVEFHGDLSIIKKYSRKTQAGQLAEILDKVSV